MIKLGNTPPRHRIMMRSWRLIIIPTLATPPHPLFPIYSSDITHIYPIQQRAGYRITLRFVIFFILIDSKRTGSEGYSPRIGMLRHEEIGESEEGAGAVEPTEAVIDDGGDGWAVYHAR